jgi:hypothetical protein
MQVNMDKFCGHVMRGDLEAAEIKDDEIVSMTGSAPLYLKHRKDFAGWLYDRGADINRSNMRIILRRLGFPLRDMAKAVRFVRAASVTDTFWIRESGSALKHADIAFKNDIYMKAALQGDPDVFSLPEETSPEITNIGSFDKGWQLRGGVWYLYKAGSPPEIFSELFSSRLAKALGVNTVDYFVDGPYIVCKNFAGGGSCFEAARAFIDSSEDYGENILKFGGLSLLSEYMDLIFLDAVVRNSDRHEFNYGVITRENGEISMAPNFDNNLALFCRGVPAVLTRKDPLVADFIAAKNNINIPYDLPELTADMIETVYRQVSGEYPFEVDLAVLSDFCMNAYNRILAEC